MFPSQPYERPCQGCKARLVGNIQLSGQTVGAPSERHPSIRCIGQEMSHRSILTKHSRGLLAGSSGLSCKPLYEIIRNSRPDGVSFRCSQQFVLEPTIVLVSIGRRITRLRGGKSSRNVAEIGWVDPPRALKKTVAHCRVCVIN